MIPKFRAWLDPDMYEEPVIHIKVNQFRGGSWHIDNRRRGSDLWLITERWSDGTTDIKARV